MKSVIKSGVTLLLLLAAILFGGASASAAGGKVDQTFNPATGGVPGAVYACSVQVDGKIIVGGAFSSINGVRRNNIARLNPDGTVDTSFNSEIGANSTVNALAVRSDGRVVIAGEFTGAGGVTRSLVARLNADGSLDTSFDSSAAIHIFTGSQGFLSAVGIQSDGKVIIGGFFYDVNLVPRDSIARLNADGSLDTSFTTSVGQGSQVFAITVQPDDRVLIGGIFGDVNGTARGSIARLNVDGSLDTSFDPGTGVTDGGFEVRAIALQADGKVVIVGDFEKVNNVPRNRIARLTATGALDNSFAPGTGADLEVLAVALQPDGKVVIGGIFFNVNGVSQHHLARLTSTGALDNTFNATAESSVSSIAVQADNRIIIGGFISSVNGVPRNGVARLNTDGTLDSAFTTDSSSSGTVYAIVRQPDGKLIVGGTFGTVNGAPHSGVARLNADGTLDPAFNTQLDGRVRAIAVQANGQIVIGGDFNSVNGVERVRLARLNTDGTLDTSFDPLSVLSDTVRALVLQPDGKIVAGGSFAFGSPSHSRLARFNTNGSVDDSFNARASSTVTSIVTQSDGKLILGGAFNSVNFTSRARVARLNPDGTLDTSFNPDPGLASGGQVSAVATQPDGRVIIGGTFNAFGSSRRCIERLNSDGTLDTSFDPGSGADTTVTTVVLQPDGKVVIGGVFTSVNGVSRNGLARLNANGSLDTTFTTGVGVNGFVFATALQPDGRVVIGGIFSSVGNSTHYGLARLFGSAALTGDFDGDGRTDIAVWQSDSGKWHLINSSDSSVRLQFWGQSALGDIAVPGDYDGDSKTDIAIFRPSEGNWYILQSSGAGIVQGWGQQGDRPVPADYDGDGRTDLAVYRPSEGNWYVRKSTGGSSVQGWGDPTDKLVPGDYDGDGRADIAVWRPSDGNWYILQSSGGLRQQQWGLSADKPVPADYDGDGVTDIAVFRPSEGNWYIIQSSGGGVIRNWGDSTDRPVPGDYDGDGRADISVWRPAEGTWYIIQSGTNSGLQRYLGSSPDTPIPTAYLPQ